MWLRSDLKSSAKKFLSKNYIKAFFVSLIIMIVSGSNGSNSSWKEERNTMLDVDFSNMSEMGRTVSDAVPFGFIFGLSFIIIVVLIIASLAFRIFLGYPLEVGGRKFFVRGAEGEVEFSNITSTFNGDHYMKIVVAMLYKGVINFLFYLLLFFPGVVKSYAYSMVPYILTDNPEIGHERALELSNEMTRGHKWEMFVLDLSFIGWYILGALAFGIGTLFVNPYVDSTKAQLYLTLRKIAVGAHICSSDELNLDVLAVEEVDEDWYRYES